MEYIIHESETTIPADRAYLMQADGMVDNDTAASIARALGKDYDEYINSFGGPYPEGIPPHRTTKTTIRPGFNFTVPLADEAHGMTDKYLFINKVKPHKRNPDLLRCQMTVLGIDDEGEEYVETSWQQYFEKGKMVISFGNEVEEHIESPKHKTAAKVAGLVVTVAGVIVAEEAIRRHRKHKKQ